MIPKTVEELARLLDLLREKQVAHFELGDLKIVLLSGAEEEEGEVSDTQVDLGPTNAPAEERSPATGLTPTEESELFYSTK